MHTPAHKLLQVVLQDGAMPSGNGGVLQVLGLAQGRQHRARIRPHEAVVVEAEVRRQRLQLSVERVLVAVVRAKCIARVHHPCTFAQSPVITGLARAKCYNNR